MRECARYKLRVCPCAQLGVAYEKKGMINEAVLEFREAVAINPNYAVACNNLGLAYLKQESFYLGSLTFSPIQVIATC